MKVIKKYWDIIRIALKMLVLIGACPLIGMNMQAWVIAVYAISVGGLLGILELLSKEWD